MNILYTCDNNYVWLMGISMISLFENNKHLEINIHLIGENISVENKKILSEIAVKFSHQIFFYDLPEINIPDKFSSRRWPKSAFARLFASEVLPLSLERVLYLDCDTIINGNLDDLYNIKMTNPIYGVLDCISYEYKKNIGLSHEDKYINAGVLLLNLNMLRQINISDEINSFVEKYGDFINYADQDVLNGVFKNRVSIVNPQYNVMTIETEYSYQEICILRKPDFYYNENEFSSIKDNPVIIHYTTNMLVVRPWFSNSKHFYRDKFIKYFLVSPWKEVQMKKYKFHGLKNFVLRILLMLPKKMSVRLIGLIHSNFVPKLKR